VRVRTVSVQAGQPVSLDSRPNSTAIRPDDGAIRWLTVEAATRSELEELFNRLGCDGKVVADHIAGEQWTHWLDRKQFCIMGLAEPTAWSPAQTWFHVVALHNTIVSVHRTEVAAMDAFIQRWWLDRPGPSQAMEAVLLHLIQSYVEEEEEEFVRIRLQVERHADGLRRGEQSFVVEQVEALMTKTHNMATVFFEQQRLCEDLGFAKTEAIAMGTYKELYHQGAQSIRRMREGIEQIQRRLEELQRQHLMDQQQLTEARMRVLTIISATFLPLTLIAGIYGMNFTNMPELEEGYAYFIVLGGMAIFAIGMVLFFIRRGWFR
jgi:magnesium transporter